MEKIFYQIKLLRIWTIEKITFYPIVVLLLRSLEYIVAVTVVFILARWLNFDLKIPMSGALFRAYNNLIDSLYLQADSYINYLNNTVGTIILFSLFLLSSVIRRLIISIFRRVLDLRGDFNTQLAKRYIQMGEYARYREQDAIFSRLKNQFPDGSKFIVLPMDMAFMKAGKLQQIPFEFKAENAVNVTESDSYYYQLEKLRRMKEDHPNTIYPFIFLHPDRIRNISIKKKSFCDTIVTSNGDVKIKDSCLLYEFLHPQNEANKFSGFKIYPALGYYPFDLELLPLWKYAADNEIPVMTHCTIGTIFYRGMKKINWNEHPIFLDYKNTNKKIRLTETRNRHFQRNFTHPLNFLCLLHPEFLNLLLKSYHNDPKLSRKQKEDLINMFGVPDKDWHKKKSLSYLKICFGHFGGLDQWRKHISSDRELFSQRLNTHPSFGSSLGHLLNSTINKSTKSILSWKNISDAWTKYDWYTIISSLMLQYPNVYADISYILHDNSIYPLLKSTLTHKRSNQFNPAHLQLAGLTLPKHKLGERVLFGTDFYMVRSHTSEKSLLLECQAHLKESEFDLIARRNPRTYLNL